MAGNFYIHFPFCRRKCSYCSLYSRAGVASADRDAYVRRIADETGGEGQTFAASLKTVYFGGGTPALCDLRPLKPALDSLLVPSTQRTTLNAQRTSSYEFTVELHPLDVTEAKLDELAELGVNRISLGVESLNDATLEAMGRGYRVDEALRAFAAVKARFDNVGIDLIVGYPGDECGKKVKRSGQGEVWREMLARFWEMGLKHCSVYSLQNERGLKDVPDDDAVLDRLREVGGWLREFGLERYEISNYAVPGFECRHNLAVWQGEDYCGLGEGACGRLGLTRTIGRKTGYSTSTVTPEEDLKERTIFRLRTRLGLDASRFPKWEPILGAFIDEGLLTRSGAIYRLTPRGVEVCDTILAELVNV